MNTKFFTEFIEWLKEGHSDSMFIGELEDQIADFFDLRNRTFPVGRDEQLWIRDNISPQHQAQLWGRPYFTDHRTCMAAAGLGCINGNGGCIRCTEERYEEELDSANDQEKCFDF